MALYIVLYTGIFTRTVVFQLKIKITLIFLLAPAPAIGRGRRREPASVRSMNWHLHLLKNCDLPLMLFGEHSIFTVGIRPIVPFPRWLQPSRFEFLRTYVEYYYFPHLKYLKTNSLLLFKRVKYIFL